MQKSEIDQSFLSVNECVAKTFAERMANYGPQLYFTNTSGLSAAYLDGFVEAHRQEHNCNCCLDFLRAYGSLVFIRPDGTTVSALWDHTVAPVGFEASIRALEETVEFRRVTGVFYGPVGVWGRVEAGGWNHFAVIPAPHSTASNDSTQRAVARERFQYLLRLVQENNIEVVHQAIQVLGVAGMSQAERFLPRVEWLRDVYVTLALAEGRSNAINNLRWRIVGEAPKGWIEMRSSVTGNLLKYIHDGLTFDEIKRRHNQMVDPMTYQRAQTAPAAGNVAQEKS